MLKQYKAVFFDWDGTAVTSRTAPAEAAVSAMRPLLEKGVKLAIVSGTTLENIAGGRHPGRGLCLLGGRICGGRRNDFGKRQLYVYGADLGRGLL